MSCHLQKIPVQRAVSAVFIKYHAFQHPRRRLDGSFLHYPVSHMHRHIKLPVKTDHGADPFPGITVHAKRDMLPVFLRVSLFIRHIQLRYLPGSLHGIIRLGPHKDRPYEILSGYRSALYGHFKLFFGKLCPF